LFYLQVYGLTDSTYVKILECELTSL
jgi:hypothetical protein